MPIVLPAHPLHRLPAAQAWQELQTVCHRLCGHSVRRWGLTPERLQQLMAACPEGFSAVRLVHALSGCPRPRLKA